MHADRILPQLILVGLITSLGLASAASQETSGSAAVTAAAGLNILRADPTNIRVNQTSGRRANPLWTIPLASLTAIGERPIFSPSRRPAPVASKAISASPAATQPQLALIGAIAGDDEGIAILMDGFTRAIIRLKTGESYSGWTLKSVRPREATLQNEQRTSVLMLPGPPAK
jgi:hypothetical protein